MPRLPLPFYLMAIASAVAAVGLFIASRTMGRRPAAAEEDE
jgi:hypothetical protein